MPAKFKGAGVPEYQDLNDERDPDWLYTNTDLEVLELWLCSVKQEMAADRVRFSEWDRDFLMSVNEQYDRRVLLGEDKPLSGKQIWHLYRLYARIAKHGQQALEMFVGRL